jgi:hypothetical protein
MSQKHLPEEFEFSHDFCIFLHDRLVAILKSCEQTGIFSETLRINEGKNGPPEGVSGNELCAWLERNGHQDIVASLTYKEIFAGVLVDMALFISEALSCSAKGRLTVAFALLRKPLKENLLCLEWLLADPVEMLGKFNQDDSRQFDKIREEKKKEIVRAAIAKTEYGEWVEPDFIYNVRFNKKFASGFEQLFQKANHLITSNDFMRTEKSNFNLIFSGEEAWRSQWGGLYTLLPILLFHAVQVADALVSTVAWRREELDLMTLRSAIGMILWSEKVPQASTSDERKDQMRKFLQEAEVTCPQCETPLCYSDAQLFEIYRRSEFSCERCDAKISLVDQENYT